MARLFACSHKCHRTRPRSGPSAGRPTLPTPYTLAAIQNALALEAARRLFRETRTDAKASRCSRCGIVAKRVPFAPFEQNRHFRSWQELLNTSGNSVQRGAKRLLRNTAGQDDLGIAARRGGVHRCRNSFDVQSHNRPLRSAQHHNGYAAATKVLLIAHVLVGGKKHVETGLLRSKWKVRRLKAILPERRDPRNPHYQKKPHQTKNKVPTMAL